MPKEVIPIVTPQSCDSVIKQGVDQWVKENLGPDPVYDASLQKDFNKWGYPWFRSGTVVYGKEGKILMMREAKFQVKKVRDPRYREYLLKEYSENDWLSGDGGWNLPSGRLMGGESFEKGAIREVKEESGWDVELEKCIDTRCGDKPGNLYYMPVYLAKAIDGPVQFNTVETAEIAWFSVEQIEALHTAHVLRSPEFVMNSLKAYEEYLRG